MVPTGEMVRPTQSLQNPPSPLFPEAPVRNYEHPDKAPPTPTPTPRPRYTNPRWRSNGLGKDAVSLSPATWALTPQQPPQEQSLGPTTAQAQHLVCPFQEESTPF